MQLVVDDLLVHYTKEGNGPVVLLLHGWGDTLETFDAIAKHLKKTYTVLSLDLPGFGKTAAPKETFDLKKYAEFVHHFVDKLGITEVYAIVGHSNGGAIAIKAISIAELAPTKLVLLASSGVRTTYTARKKALRVAAKAAKVPTKLMPEHIQKKLKKKAYSAIGSDAFVAEHLQDTFREVVGEDLVKPSRMVSSDTLLIYGSKDTATLPAYGQMFNDAMPSSRLEIIEGADHFLHHSHEKEVQRLIEGFLT